MNETETRAELIDPVLRAAGWGVVEGSHFIFKNFTEYILIYLPDAKA